MASIKDLEMAAALSGHSDVNIRKSLFRTSAVYAPTGSPLKVVVQEYAPADGERLQRLLGLTADKLAAELDSKGKPASTPVGHFRLEAVVSDDGEFCVVQLFTFVNFGYTAATPIRFAVGDEARLLARLL